MARTVNDARLDSRPARDRLEPRKRPYYRIIETGVHIGYYKGLRGGSWLARTFANGRYVERTLGAADDTRDANGIDVLSFSQAQAAARSWFDELARSRVAKPAGPYTVSQACDDYLTDYIHRRGKGVPATRSVMQRFKDRFGAIEVAKLTAKQIKDYHRELGEIGGLTRSSRLDASGERVRRIVDPRDAEAKRRRLNTANRTLSSLKAVLNLAFRSQEELGVSIPSMVAWQSAKPARGVDEPKIRYLQEGEVPSFLNACEADFRDLAAAALLTGARYGELCRFKVKDFDAPAGSLYVAISKSGKPRAIALTDEGIAHFTRLSQGKSGNDILLVRADGEAWQPSQQKRRMIEACKAAKIAPVISFHILRHTYGSRLAMRGAPMPVIAQQLGHADTRITEKHYAHLAPSYVSETVRGLMGIVGVPVTPSNVLPMNAAGMAVSGAPG